MIGEAGFLFLVLSLFFSGLLVFQRRINPKYLATGLWVSGITSFLLLMSGYIVSDFSIINVYENSHTIKPLIYKITGTWGNHEGSMLLAIVILASYLLHYAWHHPTQSNAIRVQGFVILGFVAFSLFTSNPFIELSPTPLQGNGLNPLLQDIGLATHPPVLYMGYLGYAVVFALALATLFEKKWHREYVRVMRFYALVSWAFLTLGITLGSWWAYRELGWGGYWFWDPVENASFMPWLLGTALLHSLSVVEKRNHLIIWTLLLSLFTFSFSVIGLFLVRSGIVTSVHAFANDPARGIYILAFIAILVGGSLTIFFANAKYFRSKENINFLSKEGAIVVNNMLFTVLCGVVFIGTIYPILSQTLAGIFVSVGAPYFNQTFVPMALCTLILGMIAPYLHWKSNKSHQFFRVGLGVLAIITAIIAVKFYSGVSWVIAMALVIAVGLILSMLVLLLIRWRKSSKGSFLNAVITTPARFYAMVLAHVACGIAVLAMAALAGWSGEKELLMKQDEEIAIDEYIIRLDTMVLFAKDNYLFRQGSFSLFRKTDKTLLTTLEPEVRFYPVRQQNTTESAIFYSLFSNVYVTLGDTTDDGKFAVRVFYRPLANLLWIAGFLLFISGFMAIKAKFSSNKKEEL